MSVPSGVGPPLCFAGATLQEVSPRSAGATPKEVAGTNPQEVGSAGAIPQEAGSIGATTRRVYKSTSLPPAISSATSVGRVASGFGGEAQMSQKHEAPRRPQKV